MQHYLANLIVSLTLFIGLTSPLPANTLSIRISDETQQAVADTVIELIPGNSNVTRSPATASITQQNLAFVPFVSAYTVGTYIEFPNKDKTRHHVYSFSPAKTFEIELYAGKPEAPILFDKPGIVSIGCNIHDYMQAYVYIGESPLLAISDSEGKVQFNGLPADTYQLKLWHPWQKKDHDSQSIALDHDTSIDLTIAVEQKQKPKAPKRGFGN